MRTARIGKKDKEDITVKNKAKRLMSSLLATIMIIGLFVGTPSAVKAAEGDVCEIDGVGYATISDAINAVPAGITGGVTVIKLLTWVSESTGYIITDKKITFDLNGYWLIINSGSNAEALQVNGAVISYIGEGSFEAVSQRVGLRVTNGGWCNLTNARTNGGQYAVYVSGTGSRVTVNGSVTATGTSSSYGNGIYAENGASVTVNGSVTAYSTSVYASNSTVTINGDIKPGYYYNTGVYGVYAGAGGNVTVNGNIDISGNGIYSYAATSAITVNGDIDAWQGVGVMVTGGGTATVNGSVYSSRAAGVSVSNGTAIINGTINCYSDARIRLNGAARSIYDMTLPTTREGYYTYTSGTSTVWLSDAEPLPPPFYVYMNAIAAGVYMSLLEGVTYDELELGFYRTDSSVTGAWNFLITKAGETQPVLAPLSANVTASYNWFSYTDVAFEGRIYDIYAYRDAETLYYVDSFTPANQNEALVNECSFGTEEHGTFFATIDHDAGTITFDLPFYADFEYESWLSFSVQGSVGSTLYLNGDFDNPMLESGYWSGSFLETVAVVSYNGLSNREYTVIYNMPDGSEVDLYTMEAYFYTAADWLYAEGVINHNARTVTVYVPADDYESLEYLDSVDISFVLNNGAKYEKDGYIYTTNNGYGYEIFDLTGGTADFIILSPDRSAQKKYTLTLKPVNTTNRFSGSVAVSETQTQRGKNVEVVVNYTNDSDEDIEAALWVTLPDGVNFVPGSMSRPAVVNGNTLTFPQFMEKGKTYSLKFWVAASAGYDKEYFTITAEIAEGSEKYYISDETVALNYITIEIPDEVSIVGDNSGHFTISGEAMALEGCYISVDARDTNGGIVQTVPNIDRVAPPTKSLWYKVEGVALQGVELYKTYMVTAYLKNGDGDVLSQASKNIRIVEYVPTITGITLTYSGNRITASKPVTNSSFVSASIYVGTSLKNLSPLKITTDLINTLDVVSARYTLYTNGLNNVYASPEISVSDLQDLSLSTTFNDFSGTGMAKIVLSLKRKDGTTVTFTVANIMLLVDPSGYVYDSETGEPIEGATATLQVWEDGTSAWVDWDAHEYAQHNDQITDEQGRYGWYVPEGLYRVLVTAAGYYDYNTEDDPMYGIIEVLPPRDDINIGLTPKSNEAKIISVTATTPTIVEGLAANLRIKVTGENLGGKSLIAYLSVNDVLSCRTDITNGDLMRISVAPTYGDNCKIVVKVDDGNVQGDFLMNVAEYKPEDLWTAEAAMVDGNLLITFRTDIELKSENGCVSIGGQTYNAVVFADKRTVEVKGFTGMPTEGATVVISGVKYPVLFPSFSFKFTLTLP